MMKRLGNDSNAKRKRRRSLVTQRSFLFLKQVRSVRCRISRSDIVRGRTLSQWFADQKRDIPPRVAAEIVAQIAEATEHAHQRGIVHRDLKPGNVLLEHQASAAGEDFSAEHIAKYIRIADFGLARFEASQEETLTIAGAVVGTPAYMSPEQARGEANVGPASDIFSLGAVLYELLTGERPFKKETHLATLRAIESVDPASPRKLRPATPKDLDSICLKCLRKEPADRYASAHDLSADLQRWLDGMPIEARPVSRLERAWAWRRRNPWLAASLAFALIALTTGLGTALWQRNEALHSLAETQRQTERANEHLITTQALIFDIANLETKLRHKAEFTELRAKIIKRAAQLQQELIEREVNDTDLRYNSAMILAKLPRLLGDMGERDLAIESAQKVVAYLDGIEDEMNEDRYRYILAVRAGQRLLLSQMYQRTGDLSRAAEMLEQNFNETLPASFSPQQVATYYAENLRGQASIARLVDDRVAEQNFLDQALGDLAAVEPPTDVRSNWDYSLTKCRLTLALCENQLAAGKNEAAEELLTRTAPLVARLAATFPMSPYVAEMKSLVKMTEARMSEDLGNLKKAASQFEAAREFRQKLHGTDASNVEHVVALAEASFARANVLLTLQEKTAAEEEVLLALQAIETSLPEIVAHDRIQELAAQLESLRGQE